MTVSVLAAVVVSWPLVTALDSSVPLGTERVGTVPLFELWQLWWTADRLPHLFAEYLNAPIFYPNLGVLTYSESQPLTGVIVAPLWGLGVSPALIYNLALLTALVFDGCFAYRVSRALGATQIPSLLAATLLITAPFFGKVLGVLNLLALFGVLWTVDGLIRFGRTGTLRYALWSATGLIVLYLTCQQYALMFGLFVPFAIGVALYQQHYERAALMRLVGAFAAAGGIVAAIALPTLLLHAELGFQRPESLVERLSAFPSDYLARPGTALLDWPGRSWEDTSGLFPGALLVCLAVGGAVTQWRHAFTGPWIRFLTAVALSAVLLSFGLHLTLLGWAPFETLRALVPGFEELRSPYRFVALLTALLPIFAALALTKIRVWPLRQSSTLLVVVLIGVLASAENLNIPVPLYSVPTSARTSWTDWLASDPRPRIIAHLPFASGFRVDDYEREAVREFRQIAHQRPMANGYSSFFPRGYLEFQIQMGNFFPDRRQLCVFSRSLGVTRW